MDDTDWDDVYDREEIILSGFSGTLTIMINDFFKQCMGYPAPADLEAQIEDTLTRCSETHAAGKKLLESIEELEPARGDRQVENHLLQSLMDFLTDVVSPFSPDIHNQRLAAHNPADHNAGQDAGVIAPGLPEQVERWLLKVLKVIFELKLGIDIIDDEGNLKRDEDSVNAAIQLGKSSRSLLMSGGTHVFVVTVFQHTSARIFRFDHGGFKASEKFDWTKDPEPFIELFIRLFKPNTSRVGPCPSKQPVVDGDDDTVCLATEIEQQQLWDAISQDPFYGKLEELSEQAVRTDCRKMIAARRDSDDPNAPSKVVHCLQIGQPLSVSDGLFSRATHVYRVAVLEDLPSLSVYALKDAWKQGCFRDEIDFYDLINHYVGQLNSDDKFDDEDQKTKREKAEGIAKCHGSIDLSKEFDGVEWNPSLHKTCTQRPGNLADVHERHHTRSLITPVGCPLNSFPSTKALCNALYIAAHHHQIAFHAGVLHRDVSEGNILFDETTMNVKDVLPKAFLVDWDCAEFIGDGATKFQDGTFANQMPVDENEVDKSLKRFTGTLPFMALKLLQKPRQDLRHDAHHDLESFYWLMMWMVFRHVEHLDTHPTVEGGMCNYFFSAPGTKRALLHERSPLHPGNLYDLAEHLRLRVYNQNPPAGLEKPPRNVKQRFVLNLPPPPKFLHHFVIEDVFESVLNRPKLEWPVDDKARAFFKTQTTKASANPTGTGHSRKRDASDDDDEEDGIPYRKKTKKSAGKSGTAAASRSRC
ncbi:hypothetical protein C8F01DRAFT_1364172 [Mycena amicta]|nr:hypothetical protein C8F01DRAFT_1364172 [Mycena amicta]